MPLHLDSRICGNVCIVHCHGQITLGPETKSLESLLELIAREFCRIVIAVEDVNRIDSVGLGLLVRCMSTLRKRGGDLRLAAPPKHFQELLHMTRLETLLRTYPTEDETTRSFLSQAPCQPADGRPRRRVLVIDRSPDLGAFIRAVLTQHGFEVNSASLIRDARTLLQFQPVDYVLLGPGTGVPQSSPAAALASLRSVAPHAQALELDPQFRTFDAQRAAEILLEMFQAGSTPA